jgi:hypothetical protein
MFFPFILKKELFFLHALRQENPYLGQNALCSHDVTSFESVSPCRSLPTSFLSCLLPDLARARTWRSCDANARLPRFLGKNLNACSKMSQTGSHLGRDDPKRCIQMKIMPFIQTTLAHSESAQPKATTLYGNEQAVQGAYKRRP